MRNRLHNSWLRASSRSPIALSAHCGMRRTFRRAPTLLLGGWIRRGTAILVAPPHHKCLAAADHPYSRLENSTAIQHADEGAHDA